MTTLVLLGLLSLNPEEMLARAISMIEMCGFEKPEKYRLDNEHQVLELVSDPKEADDPTKKLSLPILFRAGRYRLEESGTVLLEGRVVRIVNFFPLPEKQMLKTLGNEDERFARAMNFLTGSVFIDAETGGIVRVETRLPQEVPYEKWFFTVFRVFELKFTFNQELYGERWVPSSLNLEWHGRSKAGLVNRHERYQVNFTCH